MAVAPAPEPTTLVTMRIPIAMKERIDWMAKAMARSRNYVMTEALQRYLDQEEWQLQDILEALEEARNEEGMPHEDVMRDARALLDQARGERTARPEQP